MYKDDYLLWLRVHHPESVAPHLASKGASSSCSSSAGLKCLSTTQPSSNSTLSDILIIPKARSLGKQRKMVTTKARLIIDNEVLEDLKRKKAEKNKRQRLNSYRAPHE